MNNINVDSEWWCKNCDVSVEKNWINGSECLLCILLEEIRLQK